MNNSIKNLYEKGIINFGMRYFFVVFFAFFIFSLPARAEYEMLIPNCTAKGIDNCGGFLFDNETGDVLFCNSENCVELKLPKTWKEKVAEKQSKNDQIIQMLNELKDKSIVATPTIPNQIMPTPSTTQEEVEKPKEDAVVKEDIVEEKKPEQKECDKAKKSLCEASGGMQLGGGGGKLMLKKPKDKQLNSKTENKIFQILKTKISLDISRDLHMDFNEAEAITEYSLSYIDTLPDNYLELKNNIKTFIVINLLSLVCKFN